MSEAFDWDAETEPAKGFDWDEDGQAAESAPRPVLSRAMAALKGVQDIPTMGFGDELGGAMQAGFLALPAGTREALGGSRYDSGTPQDNYRVARDEMRQESTQARQDHPGVYYGAGIGASLPLALAGGAARGASLGARGLAGLKVGAVQGAVSGAGMSEADSLEGVGWDAMKGMAIGGPLGAALPFAGAAARGIGRAVTNGMVRPTEAAQELIRRGVDNLTIGQMNPKGLLGRLEETAQPVAGLGNIVESQRDRARQLWQKAALSEAVPPGGSLPLAGKNEEKIAALHRGFNDAYESIRDSPLSARATKAPPTQTSLEKAFEKAASDRSTLATELDENAVRRFLQNEASMTSKQGGITPDGLLSMRSNIRAKMSDLEPGDPKLKLLDNAEEVINNRLRYALPSEPLQTLASADTQYVKYKVLTSAGKAAAGRPGGFTEDQLRAAIARNVGGDALARGAVGPLKDLHALASAGREVFDPRLPKTGIQNLVEMLPGQRYGTAPLAALFNVGPVKRAMTGQAHWQDVVRDAASAVRYAAPRGTAETAQSLSRRSALAELLKDTQGVPKFWKRLEGAQ